GNLCKAVWQPAGFCIPLFRPPRHSRTPPAADPAGEPRLFLPRCPPLRRHHQGSVAKTDRRVSPLGGSLRPKTSNPHGMGRKGRAQGGLCPPLPAGMERQNFFGVYFILKSMEVGPSFRSAVPRFPVEDPDYRIIARQRCRYTHYYFY